VGTTHWYVVVVPQRLPVWVNSGIVFALNMVVDVVVVIVTGVLDGRLPATIAARLYSSWCGTTREHLWISLRPLDHD
jgi:hypothetical protein